MLLVFSWAIAIVLIVTAVDVLVGGRQIRDLAMVAPLDRGPLVSIIVAARNEERGIEAGVRSLLRLSYPSIEVIVVNDRSTDRTGAILTRVEQQDPRLIVVSVATLPVGWLGKNHALALGAARARGELLLFTDADVVFEPSILGRAVRVLQDDHLDHLTAVPRVRLNGVGLTALIVTFGVMFTIYTRPWKARDRRSRRHIGVGAFNLLRATAYERLGTHAAIALRPDDDMRLARAVKQAGFAQDVVRAQNLLEVEWYSAVGEMVNGLMKNAFAGINYSIPLLVTSSVALFAFNVWPWVALGLTSGPVRVLAAVSVAALSCIVLAHTRANGVSAGYILLYPFGVVGFIYILWRSAVLALGRGAITWRETSYSLPSLRRAAPAQPLERSPL